MTWLLILAASLLLALVALQGLSNTRSARYTVSISVVVFTTLSAMYLAANYFTANGIDDSVIYHLNYGLSGAGFAEYSGIIGFSMAFLVGALGLGYWSFQRLGRSRETQGRGKWVYIWVSMFPLACLFHPASMDLGSIYRLAPYELLRSAFTSPASGSQITNTFQEYYVTPEAAPQHQTKNLVFLYLESFERTYFDENRFPGLIKELRELEKESLSFTSITGVEGAGFTIGGMVASQCGIPLVSSSHPNSMAGMDRFLGGARCIGDVLKEAGYQLDFMGGASLEFAGKGKFYKTHGFSTVLGRDELLPKLADPSYLSFWGLYDDTLFELVEQRYQELAAENNPFALFALTLDTHHPKGHPSHTCGDLKYKDGANPILNAVHCSDKLAAQFIRRIRASVHMDNTLLVVASDHIALRNSAFDQLDAGQRTNLLMIFNPDGEQSGKNSRDGTTLDTSPTVLRQLGFQISALGLGRDLLGGQKNMTEKTDNINLQLKNWRDNLALLWEVPSITQGLIINPQDQTVTISGRKFALPIIVEFDDDTEISTLKFESHSPRPLINYVQKAPTTTMLAWIDLCSKVIALDTELKLPRRGHCLFLGKTGADNILLRQLTSPLTIFPAGIEKYAASNTNSRVSEARLARLTNAIENGKPGVSYRNLKIPQLNHNIQLTLQSSSGTKGLSGPMIGKHVAGWPRGLFLSGIFADGRIEKITHFDLCGENSSIPQSPMMDTINALQKNYTAYALLVHDSAVCNGQTLDDIFAGLPLHRWQSIDVRTPYLAVFTKDGKLAKEFSGTKNTLLQLNIKSSL